MAFPKGLGWLCVSAAVSLALAGCFAPADEENPLINPNVEAVLTTGSTAGGGTGIGSPGTGALSINPTAVRIPINETMSFSAAGGEPPYTFTLLAPVLGSITTAGLYTASATPGTTRVQVADSATPPSTSEATIEIYNPATTQTPYRIVCTDVNPPASTITVPIGTTVNFRIENGTPTDTFNVTNASNGSPQGFVVATRTGKWLTGSNGNDNGSVVDVLQVFDSSSPINVAVLRIYVSQTALTITPTFAIVNAGGTCVFTANSPGRPPLTWSIPVNNSNAPNPVPLTNGAAPFTTTYTAGTSTHGIYGSSDIIQVRDSFSPVPQIAQAKITVPGLSVYPTEARILPNGTKSFRALGGSGSYSWSRIPTPAPYQSSGSTFATTTANPVTFTAGPNEGVDVLQLTDGPTGGTIRIRITVCNVPNTRSFVAGSTYYPASGTIGGYYPLDVAVDDFNNDGIDDVACPMSSSTTTPAPAGDYRGNEVGVLLGTGAPGTFASSATKFTLPGNPGLWGIATGDYNADGNRDIAVSGFTSGTVIVMYGDGTGGFPNTGTGNLNYATVTLGGGFGPTALATYNFDRSSGDDLAVCDGLGGKVSVLISGGGGAGAAPGAFTIADTMSCYDPSATDAVLPRCFGIVVANFNGDAVPTAGTGNSPDANGYVDIAVTDYAHDYVNVFPGMGLTNWDDTFTGGTTHAAYFGVLNTGLGGLPAVNKPVGIAAGYFGGNGDTLPDIVVANNGLSYLTQRAISLLINTSGGGTPTFQSAVEYGAVYTWPDYYECAFWDVLAQDLDNDGYDDIAVTCRGIRQDPLGTIYSSYNGILVWRGLGTNSIYGWNRSDTRATNYYPSGSYFYPTGIARIDFGGQTHGTPGAPLPDLVVSSGCTQTTYTYFGKLMIYENRSN